MTLLSLLEDKTRPISDVAHVFTRPVIEAFKDPSNEDFEGSLWKAWEDLMDIVVHTPRDEQDRLVEMVQEVQELPGPKTDNGKTRDIWGAPMEWRLLPLFGAVFRERLTYSPDFDNAAWWEAENRWVNLNTFAARITAISKQLDPLDMSMFGVWMLREALEEPSETETVSETVVMAAAMWMIYASETLWQRSVDGQVYHGRSGIEGKSLEGKEWRGCSEERWSIWFERFDKLRARCKDDHVRRLVEEALNKMAKV